MPASASTNRQREAGSSCGCGGGGGTTSSSSSSTTTTAAASAGDATSSSGSKPSAATVASAQQQHAIAAAAAAASAAAASASASASTSTVASTTPAVTSSPVVHQPPSDPPSPTLSTLSFGHLEVHAPPPPPPPPAPPAAAAAPASSTAERPRARSPRGSHSYSASGVGGSTLSAGGLIGEELEHVNSHFGRILELIAEERQKVEEDKAKLRAEQLVFEEMKQKVKVVNDAFHDRVQLNVGGELFETTYATITADEGSMLKALFSGEFLVEKDPDTQAVFIDRDATHFPLVLSYLRQKKLHSLAHGRGSSVAGAGGVPAFSLPGIPSSREAAQDAIQEAKFYGLQGLQRLITENTYLVVCQSGGSRYVSIRDALKDAVDGDKILVKSGVYFECILLDKNVEIEGEGQVLVTYSGEHVVTSCAETPAVRNISVHQQGGEYHCMFVTAGCIHVEGCSFNSKGWACIGISGETTHPYLTNNRLVASADNGIILLGSGKGLIERNEISNFSLQGIEIRESSNPIIRDNLIHHGADSGIYINTKGQGIIEGNEIHSNSYNGIAVKFEGHPKKISGNKIHSNKHMGVFVSVDSSVEGIDGTNNVTNNAAGDVVDEHLANTALQGATSADPWEGSPDDEDFDH